MSDSQEKLPEWMLKLENKRKRQHRLAHEIGAGAPCFICGDNCPGLDLHFWRKLCRNCKCKKEDHDVKDDEGYEQFDILLGSGSRKKKKGGFLKIKVPEDVQNPVVPQDSLSKGVSFDWLPPNVTEDVAAEYMQQLPAGKLPISGSDGALYRRQQLEKQVPLHDLDANHCHNLTSEEIEQLMKYLDNLKNNVVGQGCVGKVPIGTAYLVDLATGRPLATSQSADPIRPLPPMPPAYNSMPRPFHAPTPSSVQSGEDEDWPPPPLPTSLPPMADLKVPSEFMPDWRLPDDRRSALGKVVQGVQDIEFSQKEVPSSHIKDTFAQETASSSSYETQPPQSSSSLPQSQLPASVNYLTEQTPAQTAFSQNLGSRGLHQEPVLGKSGPFNTNKALDQLSAPQSTVGGLQPQGKETDAFRNHHGTLDPKQDALAGSRMPTGVAMSVAGINTESSAPLSMVSTRVSSLCPQEVVNSSPVYPLDLPLTSKTLAASKAANSNIGSGVEPLLTRDSHVSVPVQGSVAQSESVSGIRGIAEPLKGRREGSCGQYPEAIHNQLNSGQRNDSEKRPSPLAPQFNYGMPGLNQHIIAPSIPVDGVKTSSILPQTVIQSSSVGTDALPKSAQMMQQHSVPLDPASATAFPGAAAPLPVESPGGSTPHLDCRECGLKLLAGDVAVFAERAGNAAWHPSCFVCSTCKELLVDLMYFYHKNNVYCGRHFAELLGIPRCFACDELIFVKEYTVAEGKVFHVKHFCCYECDDPLAGKQYIPMDDQPVCLECYERKYGKKCHTCKNKIAAGEQRVGWKHLNWHVQGNCFRCFECSKSLLGGLFVVKQEQPFCSKECVQAGLQKMAGAA